MYIDAVKLFSFLYCSHIFILYIFLVGVVKHLGIYLVLGEILKI